MLNAAGKPWASDGALKQSLQNVEVTCGTCKVYGKAKNRPVAGLKDPSSHDQCLK